jgi:hypothetical protein
MAREAGVMPAVRIVLALLLLLLAPFASSARAAPVLRLPRAWFDIVEPYAYVEARRFEPGWNRGADVVARGGEVRAPTAGRVRFAGSVAGRTVVTIDATIDGTPVVVTVTGLDSRAVRTGDALRAGDVVGSGRYVHVGAYDPDRRSRYHPVRAAGEPVGASAAAAHDRASESPVADHVADRLHAAILGTAAAHVPSLRTLATGRASRLTSIGSPARVAGMGPFPGAVTPGQGDERAATDVGRPDKGIVRPANVPVGMRLPWPRMDVPGPTGSWGSSRTVGEIPTAPAVRVSSVGGGVDRDAPSVMGTWAVLPPLGHPGNEAPSIGVRAPSGPEPSTRIEPASATSDRSSDESGRRSSGAWSIPLVLLVALLPLAAFVRRRRRPRRAAPRRVREPLPVVLPHVRPYAYPVVGREGASMLPDIALAWPDRDPGMGHDTESSARASREPEHA